MQKITIVYSKEKEYGNQISNIIWKFVFSKKQKLQIILIFLLGSALIYSHFSNSFENGIIERANFYFKSLFFGFGIGSLFYGTYLTLNLFKTKQKLYRIYNDHFFGDFIYNFDQNGITYENDKSVLQRKWKFYSKFSQVEGFLILFSDNPYNQAPVTIIPTNQINKGVKKDILNLFKNNIIQ